MSIEAPSYKTFTYIPSSLEAQVAERKIMAVYAVAYPGKPVGGATGPNQSIVCAVSLKQYLYSNDVVNVKRLVTKDLTVKSFVDTIKAKKYDKYQFTNGGQGCRYWVYTIIHMLKSEGKLSDDAEFNGAIDAISKTWMGKGDSALTGEEATGIVKGRFFALQR